MMFSLILTCIFAKTELVFFWSYPYGMYKHPEQIHIGGEKIAPRFQKKLLKLDPEQYHVTFACCNDTLRTNSWLNEKPELITVRDVDKDFSALERIFPTYKDTLEAVRRNATGGIAAAASDIYRILVPALLFDEPSPPATVVYFDADFFADMKPEPDFVLEKTQKDAQKLQFYRLSPKNSGRNDVIVQHLEPSTQPKFMSFYNDVLKKLSANKKFIEGVPNLLESISKNKPISTLICPNIWHTIDHTGPGLLDFFPDRVKKFYPYGVPLPDCDSLTWMPVSKVTGIKNWDIPYFWIDNTDKLSKNQWDFYNKFVEPFKNNLFILYYAQQIGTPNQIEALKKRTVHLSPIIKVLTWLSESPQEITQQEYDIFLRDIPFILYAGNNVDGYAHRQAEDWKYSPEGKLAIAAIEKQVDEELSPLRNKSKEEKRADAEKESKPDIETALANLKWKEWLNSEEGTQAREDFILQSVRQLPPQAGECEVWEWKESDAGKKAIAAWEKEEEQQKKAELLQVIKAMTQDDLLKEYVDAWWNDSEEFRELADKKFGQVWDAREKLQKEQEPHIKESVLRRLAQDPNKLLPDFLKEEAQKKPFEDKSPYMQLCELLEDRGITEPPLTQAMLDDALPKMFKITEKSQ